MGTSAAALGEQMAVWREEVLARPEQFDGLAREARAAFPDLELSHDVAWQHSSSRGDRTLMVLTAREGGRLVGLAPFEVHPTSLKFGVGEVTMMRKRVQRFALERAPLVTGGDDLTTGCFAALAERLPVNGAVFLRGVPEESEAHTQLAKCGSALRKTFHVVPHGPAYTRCRIAWDGSFEAYLNSLGKVTRKDLRRTLKKAEGASPAFRLERYTSEGDVAAYLEIAAAVSAKTYQRRLLGEGVVNNDRQRANLLNAARTGRFLGHILFAGEEAIAFHLSYTDAARLYMIDGGYDPAWAKVQPGMLTFLFLLQDLERHNVPVTTLDYLYGGGAYKERTSNLKTRERHYYLIKRGLRGAMLASAMRSMDTVSSSLGALLERYQLKEFVKRQIRRATAWRPASYKSLPADLLPMGFAISAILPGL
jgi:hypothetical protein